MIRRLRTAIWARFPVNRARMLCVAGFLAVFASCSAPAVAGFQWKDASKIPVAFSEASSWPPGEEGVFSARQKTNRYMPARPLAIEAGQSIAVRLSRGPAAEGAGSAGTEEPPRARISLSASRDGSSPLALASFPLLADDQSLFLPLESNSRIASLSVSSEDASRPFRISSIEALPSLRGIDRGSSGLRVSSGFTFARSEGYQELTIKRPFASLGRAGGEGGPGLLLEYAGAPKGSAFRLEARLAGGGVRTFTLRGHPSGIRTVLDESILPSDTELLTLRAPTGADIRAFYAAELPLEDFELADLGRVLIDKSPTADYSVYRWDLLPSVLILDFKDYAAQDKCLKRLAFFVEKIGFRGVLAKDEDIASLHGWNAHDYRPEDLASFFQAARDRSFPLGAEERELERLLVRAGTLKETGGKLTPGPGALISISRESGAALRWTLAVHESTHAIFFTDQAYRSFARALWASLDSGERWFWKTYFGWAAYDVGSDYLMGNEFQAYLLQQPAAAADEYFSKRKAAELLEKHAELAPRVDEYMAAYGTSFSQRARQLEAWLYRKYGIEAGRTVFLTPLR
jgi:hypothetical protein